jgi:spore coat polysaccharide biosynthesis protein SpsF (cytidylyltransferase family)
MRIGALIPIRLASERLPGKALLPLGGRPVVTHLLDRVFASRHLEPDRVIVCTTRDASDDPLVPVVEAAGARIYRGSRDDIVDRFHGAMREFAFDAALEVDGDDPFADTEYMDRVVERLTQDVDTDVAVTEGLPFGLGCKALRASAVETVWRHHTTERNDTGFMYYFTKTGLCRVATVAALPGHTHATARLTLDYPEDLKFFEAVYRELGGEGRPFGVADIVALLDSRPELLEINAGLSERYWTRTSELAVLEYERDGRTYRVPV